jgi:tetratricopeptide (TPR) repeat protein
MAKSNKMNRKIVLAIYLLGFSLILSSCATTSIGLEVLIPAEINIPQHIQKVAVANRSLPAKGEKAKNIIEGVLTGESIYADREGSENCGLGLVNQLNSGPRFSAIYLSSAELKGTGTREFPYPLNWNQVNELCEAVDADALILLETFDSDNSIRNYSRVTKKKEENHEVNVTTFYSDMTIDVNAGWRIYDNVNKRIIDEKAFTDTKVFTGKGPTSRKAADDLPGKRNAINQAGVFAGKMFGKRISPTWMHTTRKYYKGKEDDFKKAKRYVEMNDWDAAIAIWKPLTDNPEKKIGGRACYNMGVACEMKGEFNIAIEWMKKAYYDYNMKDARSYIILLERRLKDQERLDEQLGE